jgi:GNAT superfamily N-acetyltransferase
MRIEKIEIDDQESLRKVFEIYESSFPANERQSLDTINFRLRTGKEVLFAAKLQNEIVGIGFLFDLLGSDFLLLDYLAVKESHRGKQIGEALFSHLKRYAELRKKHLLMEVDDPEFGHDKIQTHKRIAFYQKNGAMVLEDVKYILPALDGTVTTEQILMFVPYFSKRQFLAGEIKDLVKLLYAELYGINCENPDLNIILQSVKDTVLVSQYCY